jgi:hypothetical protein
MEYSLYRRLQTTNMPLTLPSPHPMGRGWPKI